VPTDIPSGASFSIPENLAWLAAEPEGKAWLTRLPELTGAACDLFGAVPDGPPFPGGNVSYVVPVKHDGTDAVLKLQFASRESRYEADALTRWNGNGAIGLLGHAPEFDALLLERCRPGSFLADARKTDRLGVLAGLLRRLLVPGGKPFTPLADEAACWLETMEANWKKAGEPCEKRLVDAARNALCDLISGDFGQVLLHQDLHGHNVLAAEREPWLVIDPKPLVGDPAFSLSPVVRSFEFGHTSKAALYRLDRLSEELELDRERAQLWTVGQTMAWSFGSAYSDRHFDTVRWLLSR